MRALGHGSIFVINTYRLFAAGKRHPILINLSQAAGFEGSPICNGNITCAQLRSDVGKNCIEDIRIYRAVINIGSVGVFKADGGRILQRVGGILPAGEGDVKLDILCGIRALALEAELYLLSAFGNCGVFNGILTACERNPCMIVDCNGLSCIISNIGVAARQRVVSALNCCIKNALLKHCIINGGSAGVRHHDRNIAVERDLKLLRLKLSEANNYICVALKTNSVVAVIGLS